MAAQTYACISIICQPLGKAAVARVCVCVELHRYTHVCMCCMHLL